MLFKIEKKRYAASQNTERRFNKTSSQEKSEDFFGNIYIFFIHSHSREMLTR